MILSANLTAQCLNQSWQLSFNSDSNANNIGICRTALDGCFANSVSINYNIADSIRNINDYQVVVTYNFTGDASFSHCNMVK